MAITFRRIKITSIAPFSSNICIIYMKEGSMGFFVFFLQGLILLCKCKAIVYYFSICETHYCNLQNFQDSDETSSRRSSGYASISKVMQERPACNSSACTSCRNSWEVHNSFRLTSHKFIYFYLMLKCCIVLSLSTYTDVKNTVC